MAPYGLPKTDQTLLERVAAAAREYEMNPAEVRAQRVSFVYGQMNGRMTREEVERCLARMYGWDLPTPAENGPSEASACEPAPRPGMPS